MEEAELHQQLLSREAWPGSRGRVVCRETHASRVYLVGDHVYKVKKPVNFGFLDFSTLEKRIHFCTEEVRLNDRFAPGTYLGVGELRLAAGRVQLGGAGERVEVAVIMRRLPRARMLEHLIARNASELPAAIELVGKRIAHLHETSPVARGPATADRNQVRANWEENFRQSEPFIPALLSERAATLARRYVADFFRENGALLVNRAKAGFVRDGHGDLHSAHICLTRPIRIFDCIEFNPRFRIADTSADLSFLLMDLEFLGRHDLAAALLAGYRKGGGPDPGPRPLVTFYKVYRAWVRGKVDGLLATAPAAEGRAREGGATLARRYFNLALGYLAPRRLLLTCGLMGSGKSTLAGTLARSLGAKVFRSDLVRKELAGTIGEETAALPFGAGIYGREMTRATYQRLFDLATESAQEGTVIIDAAFTDGEARRDFLARAAARGLAPLLLYCHCPEPEARRRLVARQQQGEDPSDGRPELYSRQAAGFAAPTAAEPCITVDTTRDVDYNVQLVICQLLDGTDPR
ncbi:bifunctional aminoglycoside phosphotransferase/ATP-binding protein [Desulfuromonas carbonis]|nr:kinase [Desulfuromonas sp. DDH964]